MRARRVLQKRLTRSLEPVHDTRSYVPSQPVDAPVTGRRSWMGPVYGPMPGVYVLHAEPATGIAQGPQQLTPQSPATQR
jgi:hypothetical protein